jgi:hypothetical protein
MDLRFGGDPQADFTDSGAGVRWSRAAGIGTISSPVRCNPELERDNQMDRLSIYLTLIIGPILTGGLIIAVMSFGWYSWLAIGAAAALGVALTWPTSYAISRRIKRQDPDWDATKVDRVEGVIPDPAAPEV